MLLAAALAALSVAHFGARPAEPPTLRFAIPLPEGHGLQSVFDFAVPPDGKAVAFATRDSAGDAALWVRRLDSLAAQKIRGTDDAGGPFWSPDGRSIGFFSGAKLKRVDLDGTLPITIATTNGERTGGAWISDEHIVFERGNGLIARVAARGGQAVDVTVLDTARAELSHTFPQSIGNGKHFLDRASSFRSDLGGRRCPSVRSTEGPANASPRGVSSGMRRPTICCAPSKAR